MGTIRIRKEHQDALDRIGYADRKKPSGECIGHHDQRPNEECDPVIDPKDRIEEFSAGNKLGRCIDDKEDQDKRSTYRSDQIGGVVEPVLEKFRQG